MLQSVLPSPPCRAAVCTRRRDRPFTAPGRANDEHGIHCCRARPRSLRRLLDSRCRPGPLQGTTKALRISSIRWTRFLKSTDLVLSATRCRCGRGHSDPRLTGSGKARQIDEEARRLENLQQEAARQAREDRARFLFGCAEKYKMLLEKMKRNGQQQVSAEQLVAFVGPKCAMEWGGK